VNKKEREILSKIVRLGLLLGDYFQINFQYLTPLSKEFKDTSFESSKAFNKSYVKTWFANITEKLVDLNLKNVCKDIFIEIDEIINEIESDTLSKEIFTRFPEQVDQWSQKIVIGILFSQDLPEKKAAPTWFGLGFSLRCVLSKFEVLPAASATVDVGAETIVFMAETFIKTLEMEKQTTNILADEISSKMRKWISTIKGLEKNQKPVKLTDQDYKEFLDFLHLTEKSLISLGDISPFNNEMKKIENMPKTKTVFISYSHEDTKFTHNLAKDLEKAGLKVWLDEKEISVGDSITEKVEEGISKSDFFCLVLSESSVSSNWVQREYRTALNAQLSSGNTPRILPLIIQNIEVPKLLRDIRYADFSFGYQNGFIELLNAIKVNI